MTQKKVQIKIKKGAPKSAPAFFYLRVFKNGKYRYFTKSGGKEVSAETVKRSKKKVYNFSERKQEFIVKPKNKKARKIKGSPVAKKDVVLSTEIMGYDVIKKFDETISNGFTNYLKMSDQTLKFSKSSQALFFIFFNEIHNKFFEVFKEILNSPILFVGFTEFKQNAIFDFDNIDITFGGGDVEGMSFSEMTNEEKEEVIKKNSLRTVKKKVNDFKKYISQTAKRTFGI